MFSYFDTTPECHGQTARRTGGIAISISRVALMNECGHAIKTACTVVELANERHAVRGTDGMENVDVLSTQDC